MSDLISRQAAIDAINEWIDETFSTEWKKSGAVVKKLADIPSAERKGKWSDPVVPEDDPFVHLPYCSACGCEIEVDAYCEPLFTEYCPHCGAKMDEVEE